MKILKYSLLYNKYSKSLSTDFSENVDLSPYLTKFDIYNAELSDLSPLWNIKFLKSFKYYSSHNFTLDIVQIKNLINLESLELNGLLKINNFINLKEFIPADRITHEDLTNLTLLKNLRILDLEDTKIINIDFIEKILNIKKLNISNTKVQNVDILKNILTLRSFDLSNTRISDIRVLSGRKDLKLITKDTSLKICSPKNTKDVKEGKSCYEKDGTLKPFWKRWLGGGYKMKRLIFLYLIWIVSLHAMDLNFLKVKEIVLDNGTKYIDKNHIKASGKGTIKYKYIGLPPLDYNLQTGKFEFNKRDIEMGFILGFNARYNGEIKNGKRNGYGILESKMRLKYEGNWKDDKFHGKGILTQERSRFKYEGSFVNGKKEGEGHLSDYLSINLNEDKTKYSLEFDKINFPNNTSYIFNYIGDFKNDKIIGKGKCYLNNFEYNHKQKCIFKDGEIKSKIKLPYEILVDLKKSKKREVINIRIADEDLKAISEIHIDEVYIAADTNLKDGEKIKITFFIYSRDHNLLAKVLRTVLVNNFKIVEKFNIPEILKANNKKKEKLGYLDAELEWDD